MIRAVLLALALPAFGESLRYTINWPSGLSLGEATLQAQHDKEKWTFELTLDAAVPGFQVRDEYRSQATLDLCSMELEKNYVHGKRKARERTVFDQHAGKATRETLDGGGKSEVSFSGCPRDALAFLQFVRRELAQGRLAPQQAVYFGAVYQVRVEYTGRQQIKLGDGPVDADRLVATLKGPATDITFEVFFARDAQRTPVMARVPLSLGALSLELMR